MPRKADELGKPVAPAASAWAAISDIEDAIYDHCDAHTGWELEPSGAIIEEISLLIFDLYDAASSGQPHRRRRKPPGPKSGPDDEVPF